MSNKIPKTSECGKCHNRFTTQMHLLWPDKDVPEKKIIRKSTDGPRYSVLCSCSYFTVFERLTREEIRALERRRG